MSGMVLNFQRRFVEFIRDGTKAHTIRGERKDGRRPEPGDMLHLWTGLRQPGAEFVLRAPCLRTEDLSLTMHDRCESDGIGYEPMLTIAGEKLNHVDADLLAWTDGFRHPLDPGGNPHLSVGCFAMMMSYWEGQLPFRGWITYWDYSKAEFER